MVFIIIVLLAACSLTVRRVGLSFARGLPGLPVAWLGSYSYLSVSTAIAASSSSSSFSSSSSSSIHRHCRCSGCLRCSIYPSLSVRLTICKSSSEAVSRLRAESDRRTTTTAAAAASNRRANPATRTNASKAVKAHPVIGVMPTILLPICLSKCPSVGLSVCLFGCRAVGRPAGRTVA